jgi:CelD/BcsL family acetyltransferase involved in cellulose biosynthesis
MTTRLTIHPVETLEEFFSLENDWKDLVRNSGSANVFLTWEWMSTWWSCFSKGRQLWILTARKSDDGQLVGLAPLNVRELAYRMFFPYRELSFMEDLLAAPDHLDVISRKGFEEDVAIALATHVLENRSNWDIIRFDDIAEESLFLKRLLEKKTLHPRVVHKPCPYIQLPGTWEGYLSSLSRNERHNVLRYGNRLRKEYPDHHFRRIEGKEDLAKMTHEFFSLHLDRKLEQQQHSTLNDQKLLSFIQKIVHTFDEKGWLHFYVLTVGKEPIAAMLSFLYGGIFFFYQQGHDPSWAVYSPGRQITAYGVQQAISNRAREFDFLRGDESYKYNWTDKSHNDICCSLPSSCRGWLIFKVRNINRRIKHKFKKLGPIK